MTNKRTGNGKYKRRSPAGMTSKGGMIGKGTNKQDVTRLRKSAGLLAGGGGVVRVWDWQVG
ncbi:hypothetical protein, partial [Granulicella sp. L60]|uniref:hypothetical protein n=1 Tax=Granulicella sp. L60 TaxID=1641866 RepID=UPI001C204D45